MNRTNNKIGGASDLYFELERVSKAERKVGGSIPCVHITKKQCKDLKIDWDFVEKSAQILGLEIVRAASCGYSIEKPIAA